MNARKIVRLGNKLKKNILERILKTLKQKPKMASMLRKKNDFNYSVIVTGINKVINNLVASIVRVRNILP